MAKEKIKTLRQAEGFSFYVSHALIEPLFEFPIDAKSAMSCLKNSMGLRMGNSIAY